MQRTESPGGPRELIVSAIRVLMADRRISGVQLARKAGMSQSAFSRRMTCEHPFNADEVAAIADVLGVEFASLFAGRWDSPAPPRPSPPPPPQPGPQPSGPGRERAA